MVRSALFGVFIGLSAWPSVAQVNDGTGVASCDAFLAAYRQCIASPGLPAGVRGSLTEALSTLTRTFKESAANQYARRSIASTCVTAHQSTRRSLIEAFKCDFPDANVALADIPVTTPITPPTTTRASQTPVAATAAEQAFAKEQAYIGVHNSFVGSHNISKDLFAFNRDSERWLKPGAKITDDVWFSFGVGDFDSDIEKLEAAIARPGTLPGVDKAARELLETMSALSPIVKGLNRYQESRDFREDKFRYAQQQAPEFLRLMKAADTAEDRFSDALDDLQSARDEAKLASLPDAPPRQMLKTLVDSRTAVKTLQSLPRGDKGQAFADRMAIVAADNRALAASIDSMRPKPDSYCDGYVKYVTSFVGYGRDIARDLKTGGNYAQTADQFVDYFNRALKYSGQCRDNEARLRAE